MDKRAKVESIIQELNDDLSQDTLSNPVRQQKLEQLKVFGRDPNGSDAIYCKPGLTTLTRYAFGSYPADVVQEALRVIANALLLQPMLQIALLELEGLNIVAKIYQNQENDFEFLCARILFLCTYSAKADFTYAFTANLFDSIEHHVARHASRAADDQSRSSPMELMALTETMKLIFNLKDRYPTETLSLNVIIPDVCKILVLCKANSELPPNTPIGAILNTLASLDFGDVPAQSAGLTATTSPRELLTKLLDILSESLRKYKPSELDTLAISLVTVLRMLYETSSAKARADMQGRLLPADSERDLPLGQSSSLASQLLRLITSPGLSHLPDAIAGLMFEMSDKDATKFVKNIGYGYAAGYLMTHQIPIPDTIKNPTVYSDISDIDPVNPITGQRIDKEPIPDVPEMTQEEKEREAERLFVLFERLNATGVVNVENPVRQAMQKGNLNEKSDSE